MLTVQQKVQEFFVQIMAIIGFKSDFIQNVITQREEGKGSPVTIKFINYQLEATI